MTKHLATLAPAVLAVVGLFASSENAGACTWRNRAANIYAAPEYIPCYQQPYPGYHDGQIVAASATIFVHVREDTKLFVDGKAIEGSGPTRVVTTDPISLGKELVITLRAEGKGKGKDAGGDNADGPPKDPNDPGPIPPDGVDKSGSATKKVSIRAFQVVNVDLTTK